MLPDVFRDLLVAQIPAQHGIESIALFSCQPGLAVFPRELVVGLLVRVKLPLNELAAAGLVALGDLPRGEFASHLPLVLRLLHCVFALLCSRSLEPGCLFHSVFPGLQLVVSEAHATLHAIEK